MDGSSAWALYGASARRHPLTLDGLCACTHYLVFKEPDALLGLRGDAPRSLTVFPSDRPVAATFR